MVPGCHLVRDAGGYARYDFRTTSRLQALSEIIDERYDGQAAVIGRRHQAYPALRTALIVLPGWGPVTVQLFLRKLRGVWPGAQPPLDPRAAFGARHLGFLSAEQAPAALPQIARLAAAAGLDIRQHRDTLTIRANLPFWAGEAGDAAGARDQFAALLPVRERVLGPQHPDALTACRNLASWAGRAGDAAPDAS